jgi:RNA polymerase sigma factor (TIGR02999 family)
MPATENVNRANPLVIFMNNLLQGISRAAAKRRHGLVYDAEAGSAMTVPTDLSALVASADQGDPLAADALFTVLYDELHRMARRELSRRGGGVTLSTTTLLHEAYLDISTREGPAFPDRARFMGYACRVMRGLIIDYARRRQAQKRGGEFEITAIATDIPGAAANPDELTDLHDGLVELEQTDPRLARVVDLKFFCGFSFAEIGSMMGVSERTVQRDWEKARIFLHGLLRDDGS